TVLGADAWIIKAGRDRMYIASLSIVVLHHIAIAAVQYARCAVRKRRSMIARFRPSAAGFNAQQLYRRITDERIKHASRIAAAADASDDKIRQTADLLQRLLAGLPADHGLKIAHDPRKWMRADHRADDVVRHLDTRHPVAQRLV